MLQAATEATLAAFLVALDRKTGEWIWRADRNEKSNWATPFVWENKQRTEIVTPGTGKIRKQTLREPYWQDRKI